jgi:hypothetical protein
MNERERETAFLRQVLSYDTTAERHELDGEMARDQRNERVLRRAVRLAAVLAALALAGLGYSAIMLPDYPVNMPRFHSQHIVMLTCALGLASLTSLLAFAVVGAVCRKESNRRREVCRRFAARLFETRLGKHETKSPTPTRASVADARPSSAFSLASAAALCPDTATNSVSTVA